MEVFNINCGITSVRWYPYHRTTAVTALNGTVTVLNNNVGLFAANFSATIRIVVTTRTCKQKKSKHDMRCTDIRINFGNFCCITVTVVNMRYYSMVRGKGPV